MKLSIAHSKTDHEAAGQIVGMIASGNPDLPRGGVADMAGGRRHHPWRGVPQPSIVTESPPTCPTEAAGRDPGRHGVGGTGGVEHKFRYRHGVSPEILVRSQIKGSVPPPPFANRWELLGRRWQVNLQPLTTLTISTG